MIRMKILWFNCIVVSILILGCSPCSYEEVSRVQSPDGRVDAVQLTGGCGATTSFTTNIFIVPAGLTVSEPKPENSLFLADHVEGLKLKWREPKVLEVHYDKARIFRFTNFWQSKELENFRYIVEIRLIPSNANSLQE